MFFPLNDIECVDNEKCLVILGSPSSRTPISSVQTIGDAQDPKHERLVPLGIFAQSDPPISSQVMAIDIYGHGSIPVIIPSLGG